MSLICLLHGYLAAQDHLIKMVVKHVTGVSIAEVIVFLTKIHAV